MASRFLFPGMILLSVLVHGGAVAWFSYMAFEPPRPIASRVGRASIALRASVASRPASAAKDLQQMIPDPTLPRVEQPKTPPPVPAPATTEKINRAQAQAYLPTLKIDPVLHVPAEMPNLPALAFAAPQAALIGPLSGPKENLTRPKTPSDKLPELRPEKTILPPADVPKLDELPELVSNPAVPASKKETVASQAVTGPSKNAEVLPKLEPDTKVSSLLSLPSMASQASQGVVDLPQKGTSNPPPPYPSDALAAGREGNVYLRVSIDATGNVTAASVHQSSGVPSLDASALTTVRRWVFLPARRFGRPVPFEVLVPVEFSIRRRFST